MGRQGSAGAWEWVVMGARMGRQQRLQADAPCSRAMLGRSKGGGPASRSTVCTCDKVCPGTVRTDPVEAHPPAPRQQWPSYRRF